MYYMKKDLLMTSLEVAEITGKRHDHVMRDIREELESIKTEGLEGQLIFGESSYKNSQNKTQPMYTMGREGAMQIATRYSAGIRRKLILKLDELENKKSLPSNYLEALESLVLSERKRIELEKTNALLMHVNKLYTTSEIAKELNLKSANELNKLLNELKVQYKVNGTWVLYSKYSNLGYESIKQNVLDNGKVIFDRKWTQIGREFILKLIEEA